MRIIFLQEISRHLGNDNKIFQLEPYEWLQQLRTNLNQRHRKSKKYWQNISTELPYFPQEYLSLARWLSVFMDKPGRCLKGAFAQQSLVHKMPLESLQQQNQLFESHHQNLGSFLKQVLDSIDTFPTEKPESIKSFNSAPLPYHNAIGDLPLILYPRELLKEALRKSCSATPPEELIKALKAKGLLHTNKDADTYNWKIESGVGTYALHIQNSKEHLEKSATKSEVTGPVTKKIDPIKPKMKKSKKSRKS